MSTAWIREYKIEVAALASDTAETTAGNVQPVEKAVFKNVLVGAEGEAQPITDLQMTFQTQVSSLVNGSSNSEISELTLTNLHPSITQGLDARHRVRVFAGYSTSPALELLYQGDVIDVTVDYGATETTTKLLLGESQHHKLNTYLTYTFPQGSTVRTIADTLSREMKETFKVFDDPVMDKQTLRSFTASGSFDEVLDTICEKKKVKVYRTKGFITFHPIDLKTNPSGQISVRPENVIGNFKRIVDESVKTTKTAEAKGDHYELKLMLRPGLQLGMPVVLEGFHERYAQGSQKDKGINGVYRLVALNHKLDYEGQDWSTTVRIEYSGTNTTGEV